MTSTCIYDNTFTTEYIDKSESFYVVIYSTPSELESQKTNTNTSISRNPGKYVVTFVQKSIRSCGY